VKHEFYKVTTDAIKATCL